MPCFPPAGKVRGHLGREFRAGRTGHLLQGIRNVTVGEHIQERRLPQGNVECCLQRVVEDGIARAVGKIGENNGVLVSYDLRYFLRGKTKAAKARACLITQGYPDRDGESRGRNTAPTRWMRETATRLTNLRLRGRLRGLATIARICTHHCRFALVLAMNRCP